MDDSQGRFTRRRSASKKNARPVILDSRRGGYAGGGGGGCIAFVRSLCFVMRNAAITFVVVSPLKRTSLKDACHR